MRNKRVAGAGGVERANPTRAESTPAPPLPLRVVAMATPPLLAGPRVPRPWPGFIRVFRRGLLCLWV